MALLIILILVHLQVILPQIIEIILIKSQVLPFQISYAKIAQSSHTFIHYVNLKRLINLLSNTKKYFNILSKSLTQPLRSKQQATLRQSLNNLLIYANYLISESEKKLNNIKPHIRNKEAR